MDSDHKHDFVDISWDHIQFDFQRFVIAVTFTRTVVTGMGNGTVRRSQVVIKNEVSITAHFPVCGQQECRGIQVKVLTIGGACVPTQTNQHILHGWGCFTQGNITAFR
ncbi:hypothetical protein D3C78_1484890 [compost metagenome]